jgi:hypothetical protein
MDIQRKPKGQSRMDIQRKPKGQSRMDNPEKLARIGHRRYRMKTNTKQNKNTTQHITEN